MKETMFCKRDPYFKGAYQSLPPHLINSERKSFLICALVQIVTHCNTLQHAATHTATHTATHCNTLPHTDLYHSELKHKSEKDYKIRKGLLTPLSLVRELLLISDLCECVAVCVAVCIAVCVAACRSVLQFVAVLLLESDLYHSNGSQGRNELVSSVCHSVMQCVAACCSVCCSVC